MKTIFKRMISLILLLIFAYFSASIPGYSPMSNPMLNPMKNESYDDVHEPEPPLPVVSAEPEETAALPVFIPPTPAPKPEYSFPSDFTTKLLTDDWFQECPSPGIIDTVDYPATDYLTGTEITKTMDIYLPDGYTPEIQYDVLILTHGAGDDEFYWFSEEHDYGGEYVNAKNLVDNMIFRKACRNLIIASVTCTNDVSCSGSAYDWNQLLTDGTQFSKEIANDIIPFIVDNYSTYAADSSAEALTKARDHFAYFGVSWRAMFGYLNILPDDMEYFSWYALIAPSRVNLQTKLELITEKNKQYPVHAFYTSVGSNDQIRDQSELLYSTLISSEPFTDGQNSYQVIIENVKHHYESWCTSLYNCLLLFF